MDLLEPPRPELPISAEALTEKLKANGHLPTGEVTRLEVKHTFKTVFASFHRLAVEYSVDSHPGALILKESRQEPWGVIEAVFYREIAPATANPAVPVCYDASLAADGTNYSLLLQDVTDTHHWAFRAFDKPPTASETRTVLAELLAFHTRWWEDARLTRKDFMQRRPGNLRMSQAATREIVRQNCRELAETDLPAFADRYKGEAPKAWLEICEKAIRSWENLFVPRMENGTALTLIHGDPHKSNLFLPRRPGEDRLVWVDWQTYARGLGPYDVAYWLFVTQPPEARREIETEVLEWYHQQLVDHGVAGYSWEDCRADYRLAVIMNVFAPLGWMNPSLLERALAAFADWQCEELLA